MEIFRLAFGPERTRVAATGLLCGALMMSFGFEGPIVAAGVEAASLGIERPDLALALILVTAAYVWSGITTVRRITENLLIAVSAGRRRLIEATLRSDLAMVEQEGAENLLSALTAAPGDIMATAPLLARGFRTGCYIIGTLVVLASLAWQLFAVMAGLLLIIASTLVLNHRDVMTALAKAGELEGAMRSDLRALVLGFKELRLNRARRAAVLGQLHARAEATLAAIAQANRRQTIGVVLQASATLGASGVFIFVVPNLVPGAGATTMIAAAMLVSNISLALVRDIPLLARGEQAIAAMQRINQALKPAREPGLPGIEPPRGDPPAKAAPLAVDQLCYRYPDEDDEEGFAFGPVSASFPPGSITFVLGGNSAGKTTLIKLLAGLYTPAAGSITLDGAAVPAADLREGVSAIFADPYIFDRLYGWPDIDPGRVNGLLDEMGILGRTRFEAGRFTTTELSTGQRKRLAWVIAMIEARPILLLDQWAADQDPEFREHFYRVMLPALREAGRTVIAVTNDDRYYDAADHLLRLDDGKVAP